MARMSDIILASFLRKTIRNTGLHWNRLHPNCCELEQLVMEKVGMILVVLGQFLTADTLLSPAQSILFQCD